MTAAGPLAGITVLDLTRVLAGPFCTHVLGDLGARIIKVEHPRGGDLARTVGPWLGGVSGYFVSVNRGKESIALDLKDPEDPRLAGGAGATFGVGSPGSRSRRNLRRRARLRRNRRRLHQPDPDRLIQGH